jgi:3-methyl-2-oxobutanoate hydroxymethyltransferase
VLEAVPADLAERVTKELVVPTVGIGAGVGCDAQVLVWTDMAGLTPVRRSPSSSATPTCAGC